VSKILGVSKGRLIISQECADVLSVVAAVESGRGAAVVGEFITAVAGDRVRFVPFVSRAHFLEVGCSIERAGLAKYSENSLPRLWPANSPHRLSD
jgi:hypothetical protein